MSELINELSKSALFSITDKTVIIEGSPQFEAQYVSADLIGKTIDGKYQVLSEIGSGGMGCVYLAQHLLLDKQVALKTFKSAELTREDRLRFQREAQSIAKLSHPNIIQVFDFGYALDGTVPYYTMECLTGESLRERLVRVDRLSPEQALVIFMQVCDGLAAAHHKGIVHRDLKPDNFFIARANVRTSAETIKIIDFGIAALALPDASSQKLTAMGVIFGSPLYMSPEQSLGLAVTERSDIYSMGCALFQSLTGKPPFYGANAFATLHMHQSAPIPTLAQAAGGGAFAPAWEGLIQRLLAKRPEDRYQTIEQVLERFKAIQAGNLGGEIVKSPARPVVVHKASASRLPDVDATRPEAVKTERPGSKAPQSKRLVVSLSVLALLLLVAAGSFAILSHKEEPATVPAPSRAQKHKKRSEDNASKYTPDAVTFAAKLNECKTSKRLTIDDYNLNAECLTRIADAPWIEYISLIDCNIDNKALSALSRLKLKGITLDHSNFDDEGAAALSTCQSLWYVSAKYTYITNAGLAKLIEIKSLSDLSITGARVGDDAVLMLSRCKSLQKLDMSDVVGFTNSGLSALSHTPLQDLNLDHTRVDDGCVPYLTRCKQLQSVNLSRTAVTAGGVAGLCRDNQSIKTLYLIDCPDIKQEGLMQLRKEYADRVFQDVEPKGNADGF